MHKHILVVEDEQLVALDIDHSLTDCGYSVTTASSSEEAVERAHAASPDLILMDIRLGGTDGIETARLIRSAMDVPVVYLTAYSDDATLERARRTEPYGYLIKPFNTRELCTTIEMALQRHTLERHRGQQARVSAFLADASARLTQSLDYEAVIDHAAELLVPHHADACLIQMLPIDGFVPAVAVGPLRDPDGLVAAVIESGVTRTDDSHSIVCVPVRTRGQSLGAVLLSSSERELYTGEKLAVLEDFVQLFAVAVDNALLYRAAQLVVHQREHLLARVWREVHGSLSVALAEAARLELSGSIDAAGQQIDRLLEHLLLAASIAAGRLSLERAPERAGEIVAEALELVRPLCAEKAIELPADVDAPLIDVSCDRQRIVEVLVNLIRDAIKVTQPGSAITVRLRRDGPRARFEITDTGPGVPYRFERSNMAMNTALGPYIARGIVERHGGTIHADSVPGAGTTVSFTLPETKA